MRILRTIIVVLLFAFAGPAYAFMGMFGGGGESVSAQDGVVSINASAFANGESKHFQFKESGKVIRFFVVKDHQGALRVALDACEQCWREDKGYKLEAGAMVCVNCGMKFALNRIGAVRGGCNPHPVAFNANDNTVIIAVQELLGGAKYFPGNNK